jgi:hypothetical protein
MSMVELEAGMVEYMKPGTRLAELIAETSAFLPDHGRKRSVCCRMSITFIPTTNARTFHPMNIEIRPGWVAN